MDREAAGPGPVRYVDDSPRPNSGGITVLDIISVVLRYRWQILLTGLALSLWTLKRVMDEPRYYSTEAEFMMEGARGQSQLTGIARQFGINIGDGGGGDSPLFYVDLIKSRTILAEVAKKNYELRTDSGVIRGNLVKLFGGENLQPRQQGPFIVGRLKGLVNVTVSGATGVLTLTVKAPTADLTVAIANNILDQVNTFNLDSRQQRARAERSFVETRRAEALAELRQAEGALQSFLVQNRDFGRSPPLQLEYNRLTRTVEMRQSIYSALASAYEQAKIEEVRDLPVITVIAPPEVPLVPKSKGGARRVILRFVFGIAIGIVIAFARAGFAATTKKHSRDVGEFERLKKETLGDLTHPWRPLVRLFSWRPGRRAPA